MSTTTATTAEAIDRAVEEARATYRDANKSPVDHGHAFVRGLDGRTALAAALKETPAVDVSTGGYHGTTVHVDGLTRYHTPQRAAYDVFITSLTEELRAVDKYDMAETAADMGVWSRRD